MSSYQNQIGAKTSFGTIWMNTGDWFGVSFALTLSYKELASLGTNFTLMSPSNDFAMTTDGRLKYTGINTRNFNIKCFLSSDSNNSGSLAVYKNGSLITGASFYSSENEFISTSSTVSLSTNDYISMFLRAASIAETIRIYQVTLTAKSIL